MCKLATLIVGLGLIACVLLGIRQLRVQAAHEMAEVQKRVAGHDRELWKLRTQIAKLTTPDKVALLARKYGALVPIGPERYRILVRAEAQAATETVLVVPSPPPGR